MTDLVKIKAFVEEHREEMLASYRALVTQESYHSAPEEVNKAAHMLHDLFEAAGFKCELRSVGTAESGMMLTGVLGAERPGKPIIFGGHMDTVHPIGTFKDPFRIEDGKVYGPGVLDMKGGIIIALYACHALNAIGYNARPIKICFAPDEEKLHRGGRTAEMFVEYLRGGECMFNMETGLPTGDLCVSRKGKTEALVSVEGVSAHAGNDFAQGRNAIAGLALKITEIQKLTDLAKGNTVCADVCKGGTNFGAFPAYAEASFDLRASTVANMEELKKKLEEICAQPGVEGTTASVKYTMEMLPFECTEGVMELYHKVHDIIKEDGLGDLPLKHIGGSSDAAYSIIAGTPALCSCGIQGEWNHTVKEYAILESLFLRTVMWADVINHIR